MQLDARQRAMLAEMGVRVWVPDAVAPAPAVAAPAVAAPAQSPVPAPLEHAAAPTGRAVPPVRPVAPAAPRPLPAGTLAWRLQAPQVLYPADGGASSAPAWLIVLDSPTPDDPGSGEAGALLHNMLRAMGLKDAPGVFVSTVRRVAAGADDEGSQVLAQALAQLRPAIVLALGQSAARCVLGGSEPLGVLRTHEHHLADGTPVVVSYAPAYLLRAPKAKREAWADLQRAMTLVQDRAAMP
ncbi:MAG: hypothetical protein LC097_09050 [Burkholderiales bacterium]|nr:hypothetical protein [Burkholderiales bacterium]